MGCKIPKMDSLNGFEPADWLAGRFGEALARVFSPPAPPRLPPAHRASPAPDPANPPHGLLARQRRKLCWQLALGGSVAGRAARLPQGAVASERRSGSPPHQWLAHQPTSLTSTLVSDPRANDWACRRRDLATCLPRETAPKQPPSPSEDIHSNQQAFHTSEPVLEFPDK